MMGRRILFAAARVALVLAVAANGQALVDDLEGGHSINRFGGMWSFSGDFWDKGDSRILSAVDTSKAIPFFKGAYGGGYPDGAGNAAKLQFRFGTTRPGTPPDTYDNNVSMSSPFGADDAVLDLTGAASFSFYARSDKALQVEVVLPTLNITDWAYYSAMVSVNTTWTRHTIKLATGAGGLTRRPFGVDKALDLAQALGVQWEVNKGRNAAVTEATLWIDDLYIQGYAHVPAEPRGSCVADGCIGAPGAAPKPGVLLTDFEGPVPGTSALGLPWTYFSSFPTDGIARLNRLTGGVDTLNYALETPGKGYGNSNGASIDFELGQTWFTEEGYLMLPTVSLTNQLTSDTNLNTTGSTGIYFDYKTSGDVDYVDFKVRTSQVHAENSYAVAYVKVKGTGGQWKGAQVKWTDFILPNWGPAFREAEKDMVFTGLVGLEWSVSSVRKEAKGGLAVDNVYLLGIPELPVPPVSISRQPRARTTASRPRIWKGLVQFDSRLLRIDGRAMLAGR